MVTRIVPGVDIGHSHLVKKIVGQFRTTLMFYSVPVVSTGANSLKHIICIFQYLNPSASPRHLYSC